MESVPGQISIYGMWTCSGKVHVHGHVHVCHTFVSFPSSIPPRSSLSLCLHPLPSLLISPPLHSSISSSPASLHTFPSILFLLTFLLHVRVPLTMCTVEKVHVHNYACTSMCGMYVNRGISLPPSLPLSLSLPSLSPPSLLISPPLHS